MDAFIALLSDPQVWIAFLTLTALELVLGIDNIIFISILVDKLAPAQRERARRIGLFLAMFMRVGLLLVLSWIVGLTAPLFTLLGAAISGRDVILISGGLFLVWKSTMEIHQLTEGEEGHASKTVAANFTAIIVQIIMLDLVFSIDSIVTAIGMAQHVEVMIAAVLVAVVLMWFASLATLPHCDPAASVSESDRRNAGWLCRRCGHASPRTFPPRVPRVLLHRSRGV